MVRADHVHWGIQFFLCLILSVFLSMQLQQPLKTGEIKLWQEGNGGREIDNKETGVLFLQCLGSMNNQGHFAHGFGRY